MKYGFSLFAEFVYRALLACFIMLKACKRASFLAGFFALGRAFEASSETRSFSEACLVIIVSHRQHRALLRELRLRLMQLRFDL